MSDWLIIVVMLAPWLDDRPPLEDLHRFPPQDVWRELRQRIGPAAYYEGWMPPPVPYWRFTEKR